MNVLCGYAVRVLILGLASWPLVGILDHDKVVSQREVDRICENRAQPVYVEMQRRMAAQGQIPASRIGR